MADYDNPRPSSQPVGSVDLAVAKDDLITLDLVVNEPSDSVITNRKGKQLTSLDGLGDELAARFEPTFSSQFAFKRIGNISDFIDQQLQDADRLNAYQYPDDSGEWYAPIQSQAFPITIPANPALSQGWTLISAISEINAIARSLNVQAAQVAYSTSVGALLDDALFIYNPIEQVSWRKPSSVGAGETIVAVTGDSLQTNVDTHQMQSINMSISDDFISSSLKSLSGRLAQKVDSVGVITGDSLSYNYQDYDSTPRNNAIDCNVGMNSWSFMLRDAFIRSDSSWQHIEDMVDNGDVLIFGESTTCSINSSSQEQVFPFNGRIATFRINPSDATQPAITLKVTNTSNADKMYFTQLMQSNEAGFNCTFRVLVDGAVEYASLTNRSSVNLYRGAEIRTIEVTIPNDGLPHLVTFNQFANNSDTPDVSGDVIYNLAGVSAVKSTVNLTGTGGYTSTQLLSTWASKVTNFNPDFLICIVGANDAYQGTTFADFRNNIEQMHAQAKASNEGCEILWLSTPYSDEDLVTNEVAQKYADALRTVAYSLGDNYIDTIQFFKDTPTAEYRFDNIHWTRAGNAKLCRYVAECVGLSHKAEDLRPNYSLILEAATPKKSRIKPQSFLADGIVSSASKVFSVSKVFGVIGSEVTSVYGVGGAPAVVQVETKNKVRDYKSISVRQYGLTPTLQLNAIVTTAIGGDNTFRFAISKPDGSYVSDADWDSNPADFSFIVELI